MQSYWSELFFQVKIKVVTKKKKKLWIVTVAHQIVVSVQQLLPGADQLLIKKKKVFSFIFMELVSSFRKKECFSFIFLKL